MSVTQLKTGQVSRAVQLRDGRTLIVRMQREGLYVRESRRHGWYGPLSWESLHIRAGLMHAELGAEPVKLPRGNGAT